CWPRSPRSSSLFPYTTLFRSAPGLRDESPLSLGHHDAGRVADGQGKVFSECQSFHLLWRHLLPPLDALGMAAESLVRKYFALSRSEEHTSELQSLTNLVCRLL